MDMHLLKAATHGDAMSMKDMASNNPSILLGKTSQGNTCFHISCAHGHEEFCKDVLALNQSLLSEVNLDGETPLIIAVTRAHASLASFLLGRCRVLGLRQVTLQQDKHGCNALHYAIRCGHKDLALELIEAEPALSQGVNKYSESPMFIAAMREFQEIFEKLLEIPDSAHSGHLGNNALYAAVRNGNPVIAKKIMETRPGMAREDTDGSTPIILAVLWDKIDVLRVLLEHDLSLGYELSKEGISLLQFAAFRGHVGVARELLNHCPDTPHGKEDGWTCLHEAVWFNRTEFVEFILRAPQLRKLVNMRDNQGKTALHHAVRKCNPKIVAALLSHMDIDVTVEDNLGNSAEWELGNATDLAKTLNWNEVSMLVLKADPRNATVFYNLHKQTKEEITNLSRKDAKSLTQTYTSNTSLVAILIATITFAAAFTLPGGYSSATGSEGLPIMARKVAFQAFLISDTLAMCSSLAVAFICIIARWEDLEFLILQIIYKETHVVCVHGNNHCIFNWLIHRASPSTSVASYCTLLCASVIACSYQAAR